ncbi:MAG TPA: succinate dehydrogenase assembly factor 2 [Gammaproteobacteria bacterium]
MQDELQRLSRLRWRCRRGMKELDVVLEGYLASHYPDASAEDRSAFEMLLELPDPDLLYQLTGRSTPADDAQARVIEILRRTAHS